MGAKLPVAPVKIGGGDGVMVCEKAKKFEDCGMLRKGRKKGSKVILEPQTLYYENENFLINAFK